MTDMTLFHAPRACSRVTMTALEEVGLPFATHLIDFGQGQQKSADYLAVNPMGKVPALQVGGRVLTENAAIQYYLHTQHPDAQLLPAEGKDIGVNEGLQDLVWCSSTLHPMTRQVRMPIKFTTANPDGVRADGIAKYQPVLQLISDRVAQKGWWYGERWSIVDTYIFWNYSTAANGGMDLSSFPVILGHANRVKERPSFMRMMARERAAAEALGIDLPPEALL